MKWLHPSAYQQSDAQTHVLALSRGTEGKCQPVQEEDKGTKTYAVRDIQKEKLLVNSGFSLDKCHEQSMNAEQYSKKRKKKGFACLRPAKLLVPA